MLNPRIAIGVMGPDKKTSEIAATIIANELFPDQTTLIVLEPDGDFSFETQQKIEQIFRRSGKSIWVLVGICSDRHLAFLHTFTRNITLCIVKTAPHTSCFIEQALKRPNTFVIKKRGNLVDLRMQIQEALEASGVLSSETHHPPFTAGNSRWLRLMRALVP